MNLDRCARLVARFEGFRSFVYDDTTSATRAVPRSACTRRGGQYVVNDTGGIATTAYGETDADYLDAHWESGVTEAAGFERMRARVGEFADGVARLITAPMTDHQHEAMTSLAYNIGIAGTDEDPGFRESTVRRRFNAGDVAGAADAFRMWVIPASLRDRRESEIVHYDTPDEETSMAADLAHLHPVMLARVEAAMAAFPGLEVYSAGRSTRRQAELSRGWELRLEGYNPANPPGTSWHEYDEGEKVTLPSGPWAYAVDFLTGSPAAELALAALRARAEEFGFCFPIKTERWHAQPAEITEKARVHGAEGRLPIFVPEEGQHMEFTYIANVTGNDEDFVYLGVEGFHGRLPFSDALAGLKESGQLADLGRRPVEFHEGVKALADLLGFKGDA